MSLTAPFYISNYPRASALLTGRRWTFSGWVRDAPGEGSRKGAPFLAATIRPSKSLDNLIRNHSSVDSATVGTAQTSASPDMSFSRREDIYNVVHKREEGKSTVNDNSRNNNSLGGTLVVYPEGESGGRSGGDRSSPTQNNMSLSRENAGGGGRGRVGGGDRNVGGGMRTGNKKRNRVAPLSDADQRLPNAKRGDSISIAVGPDGVVGHAKSRDAGRFTGDGSPGVTKLAVVGPDGVACVRTADGRRGGGGARGGGGDAVGRCGCTLM